MRKKMCANSQRHLLALQVLGSMMHTLVLLLVIPGLRLITDLRLKIRDLDKATQTWIFEVI